MKTFNIKDNVTIVCESESTRTGFRHVAILMVDGQEVDRTKCCYQNRTWESFTFESVLSKMLEKTKLVAPEERSEFMVRASGREHERVKSEFKMVSNIAKMGEFFATSQKEKNDWKARMLKAGLGNQGLTMPDDWDSLTEDEKESRLNKVIEVMQ